jgi:hypothetical protein
LDDVAALADFSAPLIIGSSPVPACWSTCASLPGSAAHSPSNSSMSPSNTILDDNCGTCAAHELAESESECTSGRGSHCGLLGTDKALGERTSLWANMLRERFEGLEDFRAGSLGPRRADGGRRVRACQATGSGPAGPRLPLLSDTVENKVHSRQPARSPGQKISCRSSLQYDMMIFRRVAAAHQRRLQRGIGLKRLSHSLPCLRKETFPIRVHHRKGETTPLVAAHIQGLHFILPSPSTDIGLPIADRHRRQI